VDLGTAAFIALIAGLAGGAVGGALVGTVEAILRQRMTHSDQARWVTRVGWAGSGAVTSGAARPEQFDGLSADSRKVMTLARQEALQNGHTHIGTEHLAMALRLHSYPALSRIWGRLAVDPETMRRRLEAAVPPNLESVPASTIPAELFATPRLWKILAMARTTAAQHKEVEIAPEHLLVALSDEGGGVGAIVLASFGATAERVRAIAEEPAS
jgi:ATP-dependent Clp protease ATP-binding subunit ClpC